MKHVYLKSILFCLLSAMGAETLAYDIQVKNDDGVTIYYNWTNNDTELEVTSSSSYFDKYSGNVVIPGSVSYNGNIYSVTTIGNSTFSDCSELTSVTIPNNMTSIGDWAFSGCSSLASVTIPNSVASIGDRAFYRCSGLTSVTIPNNMTSIGDYAFSGCI